MPKYLKFVFFQGEGHIFLSCFTHHLNYLVIQTGLCPLPLPEEEDKLCKAEAAVAREHVEQNPATAQPTHHPLHKHCKNIPFQCHKTSITLVLALIWTKILIAI